MGVLLGGTNKLLKLNYILLGIFTHTLPTGAHTSVCICVKLFNPERGLELSIVSTGLLTQTDRNARNKYTLRSKNNNYAETSRCYAWQRRAIEFRYITESVFQPISIK